MDTEPEAMAPEPPTEAADGGSSSPVHASGHVTAGDGLLQAVQSMLELTVVALFLVTFTFQPFRIPSASMEPTLLVGDFLLVDKQAVSEGGEGVMPRRRCGRGM